ncbi:MAG: iron-sulfur cluster assembly scaffold protein [Candidatus Omnitrophota bacterium]|nr:MAG: iron-sulfur cluster assembly scaffold protein [Candidatus Omnitrophota bacterium]
MSSEYLGYTEKVLEHFRNPHNMGKLDDADGIGKAGSSMCGDIMWIYIRVENNTIVDCKFETVGCAAAIASSSVLTDFVKGKTIEEAQKISNKDVIAQLGGLPPIKVHCSVLAEDGIKAAIEDYLKKSHKL